MRLRSAVLLLCLLLAGQVPLSILAQESSIQVLGPPAGGGDSVEGDAAGETAAAAEPAPPPPCGTQPLTIARMQWPSSEILAAIHARLLKDNFGCDVRVQQSDMAAAGSSMGAIGQPAVVPEMWITRVPAIWNAAVKAQKVRQAGTAYAEGTFEGWFVPDYAVERWSDITSIEGLKAHAAEFGAGRSGKPRFISCPLDWGCAVINRNMLKAFGLDGLFDVVEPANRFELDTVIAEAVSRKEPILFYYWQPNAILSQFAFQQVDLGPYNQENLACLARTACAGPLPSSFPPEPVIIAVSEWVFLDAPQVAAYFGRARLPLKEMNAMLQALSVGGTADDVAASFVATREEVWRPWLGQLAAAAGN